MMLESALYQEDLKKINESVFSWEELEQKNILITGGTGLIGSCLVDVLLFRNEHLGAHIGIWVLCRNEARAKEVFGEYLEKEYLHLIVQDISEPLLPESFKRRAQSASGLLPQDAPESMDYIIHAASKGDPNSFVTDPLGVMNANVLGMHWLLEYAKRTKTTKILYLSSGEAYGKMELPEDIPISETMTGLLDSLNVRNCYGISKRAAETMCVSAASEYQVPVCIARLCHIYGPTMTTGENRVIFQFLQKALDREEIVLKSEGLQKRSYCYVADAAAALFTILFRGAPGEAYNVSNEKSVVTIRGLAEILGSYAGSGVKYEQQTESERRGNSGIMHAVLDNQKLLELGVRMEYDMEAGLKQTLEIMKEKEDGKRNRDCHMQLQ
ncbi:MAG: NAD-dependent epimerase/dehydratase family protein [Lachnospiraceae bacterium]|nr:NAD-dependent epimerase/dehydratase family protein [Lachnospiraceae bacterium]